MRDRYDYGPDMADAIQTFCANMSESSIQTPQAKMAFRCVYDLVDQLLTTYYPDDENLEDGPFTDPETATYATPEDYEEIASSFEPQRASQHPGPNPRT